VSENGYDEWSKRVTMKRKERCGMWYETFKSMVYVIFIRLVLFARFRVLDTASDYNIVDVSEHAWVVLCDLVLCDTLCLWLWIE